MTTALCVTAGREQVASIRRARELGIRVIAIDRSPVAPGLAEADEAHALDPSDEESVVDLARHRGVELVLPVPIGKLLQTIGAVNDALGLRGVSRSAAVACTDKLEFRKRLREVGLSPLEFCIARGRADVLRALEGFPLPCVLKPRSGAGSRGVVVIRDRSEISALVDEHFQTGFEHDDTLIEEYVHGYEVGVDAVVSGGRVTLVSVRHKDITAVPYRQVLGYRGPVELTPFQSAQLQDMIERTVKAVGCNDSLMHLDVIFVESGVPFIVEMSPRPAGLLMAEAMVPAMTGVDLLREGIRMLLGEQVDFTPKRCTPVALRFLQFPAGKVSSVPEFAWVWEADGVIAFSCNVKPGDRLRPISTGADVLSRGYVMTTGMSLEDAVGKAEQVMTRVCAAVEVVASDLAHR